MATKFVSSLYDVALYLNRIVHASPQEFARTQADTVPDLSRAVRKLLLSEATAPPDEVTTLLHLLDDTRCTDRLNETIEEVCSAAGAKRFVNELKAAILAEQVVYTISNSVSNSFSNSVSNSFSDSLPHASHGFSLVHLLADPLKDVLEALIGEALAEIWIRRRLGARNPIPQRNISNFSSNFELSVPIVRASRVGGELGWLHVSRCPGRGGGPVPAPQMLCYLRDEAFEKAVQAAWKATEHFVLQETNRARFFSSLSVQEIQHRMANEHVQWWVEIGAQRDCLRGDSLGAAMAVAFVSVLTDLHYNAQYLITATTDEAGNFGPVAYLSTKIQTTNGKSIHHILVAPSHPDLTRGNLSEKIQNTGDIGDAIALTTRRAEFNALPISSQLSKLPIPADTFIGREEEIATWYTLLTGKEFPHKGRSSQTTSAKLVQPTRLLTITGFGGVGKSRAALHFARLCAEHFPDGVYWVSLETARKIEDLFQMIAQTLPFDHVASLPVREQVFDFLRERHLLLILDNSEQMQEAPSAIRDLLNSAPYLRLLVTSRRVLGLRAEKVFDLSPLSISDSQRLFVERASSVRADFTLSPENAEDIAALCRGLEGMPLAIELAAARITGMTARQMIPRLQERFRLLQTSSPDVPVRQRALSATIAWSYDLLATEERSVLAQLGVFSGGFTLEDAEVICEGFDIFESVLELRRNSFFRTETIEATQQDRFLMLESLRVFAQKHLNERQDAEMIRRRHANHYLNFARQQERQFTRPGEARALAMMEVNQANLYAALLWASRKAEPLLSAELALLIGIALQRRGYDSQAVEPIETGLEMLAPDKAKHPELYARLLVERAGIHSHQIEVAAARGIASEARKIFEEIGESSGICDSENILGIADMHDRKFGDARTHFQLSLEHALLANDIRKQGRAHSNLGLSSRKDLPHETILNHYQEALQLQHAHGDQRGVSEILNHLGTFYWECGDLETARFYYRQALDAYRVLGYLVGISTQLHNLGEIALETGQFTEALHLLTVSYHLMRETNSPHLNYARPFLERAVAATSGDPAVLKSQLEHMSLSEMVVWALKFCALN